jgi:hypothetical protein
MSEGEKTQRGRKPENLWDKYKIGERLPEVQLWYSEGADDKIVAKKLNIGLTTFYKIKKQYPKFSEVLQKGKDIPDEQAVSALFKRVVGYDYEEVITEYKVGENGVVVPSLIRKIKKHVPGDVNAQRFWTMNRRPNDWREKKEISRPSTIKDFDLDSLPPELRANLDEYFQNLDE